MAASMVGQSSSASSACGLQRDGLAAAIAAVRRDEHLGATVVDAAAQGLGREATEDDRVGRPDPRARQHRDRQLRDHRHVDRDPVAGRDAELEERVGGLADLALEVGEGQRPGVARFADPVVGDLVAQAALDVPVDAVVGDVELAAGEPLGERQVPLERRREGRRPVDAVARVLRPEGLEVGLGLGVHLGLGVGRGDELGRRRVRARFGEEVLDLRGRQGRLDAHGGPSCSKSAGPAILPRRARSSRSPARGARRRSRRRCRRPAVGYTRDELAPSPGRSRTDVAAAARS